MPTVPTYEWYTLSRPEGRRPNREPREGGGDAGPSRPRVVQGDIDRRVLALREDGRTFSAIARTVGMNRAVDAHKAMLRYLKAQPEGERRQLVARELQRLDTLEVRIRTRDAGDPEKLARRIGAVKAMRDLLAGMNEVSA